MGDSQLAPNYADKCRVSRTTDVHFPDKTKFCLVLKCQADFGFISA